jgi:hypothetical protein
VAGLALIGRNIMTRRIVVKKDTVISNGEIYVFSADHWHEYPDKSLELVDYEGEVVASFMPHRWSHVYYEDRLIAIEERTKS